MAVLTGVAGAPAGERVHHVGTLIRGEAGRLWFKVIPPAQRKELVVRPQAQIQPGRAESGAPPIIPPSSTPALDSMPLERIRKGAPLEELGMKVSPKIMSTKQYAEEMKKATEKDGSPSYDPDTCNLFARARDQQAHTRTQRPNPRRARILTGAARTRSCRRPVGSTRRRS